MANNGSSRVQTDEPVVNLNSNDKANCACAVFLQQTAIAPPYHSFNMGIGPWFTDRLMPTVLSGSRTEHGALDSSMS